MRNASPNEPSKNKDLELNQFNLEIKPVMDS